jgi:adenylylsulfate kinase
MGDRGLSGLFVGRRQPFHEGHKTLIETVLKNGKPVVIAIRDTEIGHSSPYTPHER